MLWNMGWKGENNKVEEVEEWLFCLYFERSQRASAQHHSAIQYLLYPPHIECEVERLAGSTVYRTTSL